MGPMTQEDGFIEVKVNLYNRTPIIRWVRPVIFKKLPLLFDTYAMIAVSRGSGLDFTRMDQMDPEEYLAWMIYGGYTSYQSLKNRRVSLTIETCVEWVKGILYQDRLEIFQTIQKSKELGSLMESYQAARNPDGGSDGPKKAVDSVTRN